MTRWLSTAALALLCAVPAAAQWPMTSNLQQPDEELVYACDGMPQYGAGVAVSSFVATVTKRAGTDAKCLPAAAIKTDMSPTGTLAPVKIAPSARHGCDFQLHILATMANGQKIACDRLIQVREATLQ